MLYLLATTERVNGWEQFCGTKQNGFNDMRLKCELWSRKNGLRE